MTEAEAIAEYKKRLYEIFKSSTFNNFTKAEILRIIAEAK